MNVNERSNPIMIVICCHAEAAVETLNQPGNYTLEITALPAPAIALVAYRCA